MKKLIFNVVLSIMACLACAFSCDDAVQELPVYPYARVSKCERDSIKTFFTYSNQRLASYKLYIHDNLKSNTDVNYSKPGLIYCDINGIIYEIQLANTRGSYRAESVAARVNGALLHYVHYTYDKENRIKIAQVDAEGESVYTNYYYKENRIIVEERGYEHPIELSDRDNIGYVCNVLDFAGATKTSKYVINPDLYFLNIYGAPIEKLPVLPSEQVVYSSDPDNLKLLQVGKYHYDY